MGCYGLATPWFKGKNPGGILKSRALSLRNDPANRTLRSPILKPKAPGLIIWIYTVYYVDNRASRALS